MVGGNRVVRPASRSSKTIGAALLGIAIADHTREILILKQVLEPAIALLLDGIPAEENSGLFGTGDDEFDARGLALVHTLVDAYGGHISLEDNDPRGTVVNIQLPRARSHDDAPPA